MAKNMKWFQTRFRKRMASQFRSLRRKTCRFVCSRFPPLFFRVCGVEATDPGLTGVPLSDIRPI